MDELSEAITAAALARGKRCSPAIFVEVPSQLADAAVIAVQAVFGARFDEMFRSGPIERIIDVLTIDPVLFEDPVRLMLNAGAHVSGGRVKLSPSGVGALGGTAAFRLVGVEAGRGCDGRRVARGDAGRDCGSRSGAETD